MTGVQTCALPIYRHGSPQWWRPRSLCIVCLRFELLRTSQKGRELDQNHHSVSNSVLALFSAIFRGFRPNRPWPAKKLPLGQALGQVYSPARMRTPFAWLTGLVAFLLASPADALAKAADRPNIIFFLSDDHRWDRMGCAGHPFLKTPTMDRLAAQGVRFSNMFVDRKSVV